MGGRFVPAAAAGGGGWPRRLGVPRKMRLTLLRKKVLRERLHAWRERNGIVAEGAGGCGKDNNRGGGGAD